MHEAIQRWLEGNRYPVSFVEKGGWHESGTIMTSAGSINDGDSYLACMDCEVFLPT